MADWTTRAGPMARTVTPLEAVRARPAMPAAAAWRTMAEIAQKASESWAKRKMKATALELAVHELLDSPRRRPQRKDSATKEEDPEA
eukprot:2407215-Karenia_brevis.AAC.1